jgi:hypothetical protein
MTNVNDSLDLKFAEGFGIDRDLAFALVAESMTETERAFGSASDGGMLERYALEAVIDLLSRPARVRDFLPELVVREVRQSLAER